ALERTVLHGWKCVDVDGDVHGVRIRHLAKTLRCAGMGIAEYASGILFLARLDRGHDVGDSPSSNTGRRIRGDVRGRVLRGFVVEGIVLTAGESLGEIRYVVVDLPARKQGFLRMTIQAGY